MGQDEIYNRWLRKPLEQHGAVCFWFAGRWSILVTRPQYLTDLFRNENIYTKAGNQKKVPWSVLATLLGDNIISSHGDNWKLYSSIMKPGMTKRNFDYRPLVQKSRKLSELLLQAQSRTAAGKGVMINHLILRYAISVMGQTFLDIDFQCLEDVEIPIVEVQSTIKRSIFKPFYMNFPIADKYPVLFPSRKRALILVRRFESLLYKLIQDRPLKNCEKKSDASNNQVVHMLEKALKEGKITQKQYRDNLKITFIVAHENTQLLLNSMFYQIGINKEIQEKLRDEVNATKITDPTANTVNRLPYLTSVIYELLRLYPPISQLTNRVAESDAMLGDTVLVPANTYVGWNAYGAHTSSANWGPRAKDFIPERWGSSVEEMQLKFRRETTRGTFIPFNAHMRKCLGQAFVLLQMKIAVFELVRGMRWKVDPDYKLKLPGAGVLAPVGCKIIFEEIQSCRQASERETSVEDTSLYDSGDL
ncbi:MAG: hypothetical protein LQ352_003069 [Teloschistes flavicans]|nr:MAG: hypothetical protein LQ352_003069 [Teloschistes flavicans]